jgi:hypothetical protein
MINLDNLRFTNFFPQLEETKSELSPAQKVAYEKKTLEMILNSKFGRFYGGLGIDDALCVSFPEIVSNPSQPSIEQQEVLQNKKKKIIKNREIIEIIDDSDDKISQHGKKRPNPFNSNQGPVTKRKKCLSLQEIKLAFNECLAKFNAEHNNFEDISFEDLKNAGREIYKIKDSINLSELLPKKRKIGPKTIENLQLLFNVVNPYPYSEKMLKREDKIFERIQYIFNKIEKKNDSIVSLERKFQFEVRPECIYNHAVGIQKDTNLRIEILFLEILQQGTNSQEIQAKWGEIVTLLIEDIIRFEEVVFAYRDLQKCGYSILARESLGNCYQHLAEFKILSLDSYPETSQQEIISAAIGYFNKAVASYTAINSSPKHTNAKDRNQLQIDNLYIKVDNIKRVIEDLKKGIIPEILSQASVNSLHPYGSGSLTIVKAIEVEDIMAIDLEEITL